MTFKLLQSLTIHPTLSERALDSASSNMEKSTASSASVLFRFEISKYLRPLHKVFKKLHQVSSHWFLRARRKGL